MPTARPDIVALLVDLDINVDTPPNQWVHLDGRPTTLEELALVTSATRTEFEAVCDYTTRAADYHKERLADFRRAQELIEPYAVGMPDRTPMRQIVARMPQPQRDEVVQIMDRLTTDGTLRPL